jgi:hypothetical protein
MSNSFDPDSVPVSQIEDSRLSGNDRFSIGYGQRLHEERLGKMHGVFLTLLDEEGRILFFVAGALRRPLNSTADEVVLMTPYDLYRGAMGINTTGAFQPEYRSQILEGPERHQYLPLVFRDIPFLSAYLGRHIPEAKSWGILRCGPAHDKGFVGRLPNAANAELFLDPQTWKESSVARSVPGSGSNNLVARLAPKALSYAENYPSAWALAVSSAYLFGGVTTIPTTTPIKSSTVLSNLIDHETRTRKKMMEGIFVHERRTTMKILIDGSNVQRRANNSKADLDQLVSLCLALFKEGYDFIVYIDASTRHKYPDDQAKIHLNSLLRECPNIFVENGGLEADDFLLNRAKIESLPVLTNDQFRQQMEKYPFVSDQSRFIRFSEGEAPINIPSLGLIVHVKKEKSDLIELRSLLAARMVRIVDSEGHYVSYNTEYGHFLKSGRPKGWGMTTFLLVSQGQSRFAILAPNRRYVSVDITHDYALVADRKIPGEWELFTLRETDCGVYLRGHNHLLVSARRDEGGLLRACAGVEELWERFTIEDVTEPCGRINEVKPVFL